MFNFVKKKELQEELFRVRQEERQKTVSEYENKMEILREEIEEKYCIQLASKDAEIKNLICINQDLQDKIENSKKAYRKYRIDILGLEKITNRISDKIFEFTDQSTLIYQSFNSVKDEVDKYKIKLLETDKECSELLQIEKLEDE